MLSAMAIFLKWYFRANLSQDYFTNRQDRYIMLENCKELCDYYEDLVKVISKFSFQLQPDDTVCVHRDFPYHPYQNSKKEFNKEANKLLESFVAKYAEKIFPKNAVSNVKIESESNVVSKCVDMISTNSRIEGEHLDTIVFPLLQMRTMGINQDELVTTNMLASAPINTDVTLATAYFNLTGRYWNAILQAKPNFDLIMAHPKAMGFYGAAGMAGGIPNAYSLISKRRYNDVIQACLTDKIQFLEFHRSGWTFHGKGLWAIVEEQNERPINALVTLIGSPNFGKRSVYRDMESQVGIVTTNSALKSSLIQERDNMKKDTSSVTIDTFKENDRKIKWWVYLIATFMNEMF